MIFSILVSVIVVLICAGVVKFGLGYLNTYRLLLRSNCFRGPKAYPLIGNANHFMGDAAEIYTNTDALMTKYESPFRIWFGPQLYFVVHEAEHVKSVLLHPDALEKVPLYTILKPLVRDGLITAEVSKWRPHRKALEPFFNRKVLESFVQTIAKNASSDIEKMVKESRGEEFDVTDYMYRYVFDTLADTALGVPAGNIDTTYTTFFHRLSDALEIMTLRIMRPWLYPDFIFKFSTLGRKLDDHVVYLNGVVKDMLDEFKSDVDKRIENGPRECLLGVLLTSGEGDSKFTDEEIYDELVTILGAGFETSAGLLVTIVYVLANNPEFQEKIYAELCDVRGESNLDNLNITLQDVERMEYLTRIVKETLRIFPPVPMIFRYLSADVNIGEYTFPATSSVMINITQAHRNEKNWPEPMKFNPDRFLPDHPLGPRHPFAFIPFSGGVRNCIGMKYAMISAKVFLIVLTSKFIIKTRTMQEILDLKLKTCISVKAIDPLMISLERRRPAVS